MTAGERQRPPSERPASQLPTSQLPSVQLSKIRGRVNAEQRVLGLHGLLWLCALTQFGAWAWISLPTDRVEELPWLQLAVPHIVNFIVVMTVILNGLPSARWPRSGSLVRLPNPWILMLAGFPALPFAIAARLRDGRLSQAADPEEVEIAFRRLLVLPRSAAVSFVAGIGLAFLADVALLANHVPLTDVSVTRWVVLAMAVAAPYGAISHSRTRAILRPEYLTAPRPNRDRFPRVQSLRSRLLIPSAAALVGLTLAPVVAVSLWADSHTEQVAVEAARESSHQLAELVATEDAGAIGRFLAAHPDLSLRADGRDYGRVIPTFPARPGVVDVNDDGVRDVFVHRTDHAIVVVPLPAAQPLGKSPLLASIVAFLCALAALWILSRDAARDVTRATEQVATVARGEQPPHVAEASFSCRELREFVKSVDRLVARITETNVAKYVVIEKAQEADRLKSQFLANMSHDLRSPLNSILGFSELLLTGIDGELDDDQRPMVQLIHDSGRHLLQQIDDILDTAKVEAGRMEMHAEPTPVATLVSRAIQNARKRQNDRMSYSTEAAAGLPPAFVDPYRTVQAVENVLVFASERLDAGELAIRSRLGKEEGGRVIVITVETPERPASADQLARVLKGFYQIPGHKGLGLALPIAGSIVELQGGSLGIEEMGDGMLFTISLPAPDLSRRRSVSRAPSATPQSSRS